MLRVVVAAVFAVLLGGAATACGPSLEANAPRSIHRPAEGAILRRFGLSRDPILNRVKLHAGIDFGGDAGLSVVAAAAGKVTIAERRGDYGNYILIEHGGGVASAYAHLRTIGVAVGDCLTEGAPIATLGSTGLSSGPHLHFEVLRAGRQVDPEPLLGQPVR